MNILYMWVIYRNPKDYPGKFVVRRRDITGYGSENVAAEPTAIAESLDDARAALPLGLYPLGREPQDDPVIVEVWM